MATETNLAKSNATNISFSVCLQFLDQTHLKMFQDGHSSWKSWKCPWILFCPGNVLEDDPFLAKGPGKVLKLSN